MRETEERELAKKGGLGRGLGAIFEDNVRGDSATMELRLSEMEPNRAQPRTKFDDAALGELADSIRQHGVLQPILVRPLLSGGYQIVAGERRWRAARMAGLSEVPVLIRELTDREVTQIALIENLQREDLTPLEEAKGYRALMEEHGMTQEETAEVVGKSRSAVTNAMRLLNLPEDVQALLEDGSLSAGHARAILGIPGENAQREAARRIVREGLSVREAERLARRSAEEKKTPPRSRRVRYYSEAELALTESLHRVVHVTGSRKKGALTMEFYGEEDLKNLLAELKLKD